MCNISMLNLYKKEVCKAQFLNFVTETISRTDEGQLRPKKFVNKCGTNIYFLLYRQRFGPSPSPNFKQLSKILK